MSILAEYQVPDDEDQPIDFRSECFYCCGRVDTDNASERTVRVARLVFGICIFCLERVGL